MITQFIGVPGSGKTTALAWVARRALRKRNQPISICGYLVSSGHPLLFTNFPFDGAFQLDYENLGKYSYEDALILIDEITMFSDSREYKNFSSALKFFYSQHRKFHLDIIVATQAIDDADKKIRNLTVGFYLLEPSIIPGINKFTAIVPFFDIINFKPTSGYRWGKSQYFLTKPLFKLFDSFATLGIKKESLPPAPLIPWKNEDEGKEIDLDNFRVDDV